MLARAFYTKLVRVGLANGANGYRSSKVMKDELEDKKGAFGCIPDGAQCIIYVMHVDPYGLERLNPDSSTLRSDRGTRQGRSTQSRYRILLVQIHVHCLFLCMSYQEFLYLLAMALSRFAHNKESAKKVYATIDSHIQAPRHQPCCHSQGSSCSLCLYYSRVITYYTIALMVLSCRSS